MSKIFLRSFVSVILICLVFTGCSNPENTHDQTAQTQNITEEEFTEMSTTEEAKKIKLRIGSYNIANGREIGHDMRIIANDILENGLDIVGLQEVDRFASRSNFIDTIKLLSEYTGFEYYTYTKSINIKGDAGLYGTEGEYGTAILSKYPISDFKSVTLSSGDLEQRAVGYADITVDGYTFTLFNTHLSYEDKAMRTEQFSELVELIGDRRDFLLTADFNTEDLAEFACFESADTVQHHKRLVSYPSNRIAIDNIVFSGSFELDDCDIYKAVHSDHRLLWADFTWTP